MTKTFPRAIGAAGFIAAAALSVALTGCNSSPSNPQAGYPPPYPVAPPQGTIVVMDDYDYYPGYEVYYSRNRREYVYLEGRTWVRRPAPRDVTVAVLFASPSVRMEFRDSPEQHHYSVIRSYPQNWRPEGARIRAEQAAVGQARIQEQDRQRQAAVEQARIQEQNRQRQAVAIQVAAADDYDYYPGYEVYYSRNRHEYVYLEGRTWVRRPAPRNVTLEVLFASPSVRMDFQDAPEHHHGNIQKSYPKNWSPPGRDHSDKDRDDRDDRKDDKDDRKRGRK